MNKFEKVQFHGEFRDYQVRVLDNADRCLKDGKINIVAAPGSGKTVLGLELIRRIGHPCVILSPTTAIREQWGERFRKMFLENQNEFDALFSNDLHTIRLVNSITYQALYTAVEKTPSEEDGDIDCSDIDVLSLLKENGIKTICLDEAHHLKNEWQRALEKFINQLEDDVKIISLTATPPYDSEGAEWSRYINICGDIDEEIFVPELVAQHTLCPHQDYVYFNYPAEAEIAAFQEQTENAAYAIEEIGAFRFISDLCVKLNTTKDYEMLFSCVKEYIALLVLFQKYGFAINSKLIKQLTARKGLPHFKLKYAETAIQFLLEDNLLDDEQKGEMIAVLKKHQVYHKRKVTIALNEKLKRALISSVGKLESIKQIAKSEFAAMGGRLRMLILTDYIKKENVAMIVAGDTFNSVNVVSIFETIRKSNENLNVGVLSGSLVILPDTIDLSAIKHKKQKIEGTRYSTVEFSGSNHHVVELVGKLFEKGEIQVLVGTKALLGEGWDSPCINSLILASFVGSFVLSNQMRGRAIRIDKNDPNKTANIWHLVTVEPEYLFKDKASERIKEYLNQDTSMLTSYDFEILKRRFDSFMGPHYETGVIESGIERITAITPPYDPKGIDRINHEMLIRSSDRTKASKQWTGEVADGRFAVSLETKAPKEKRVPVFTFFNFALNALVVAAEISMLRALWLPVVRENISISFGLVAAMLALSVVLYHGIKKLVLHSNPARSMKALGVSVYQSLQECGLISSAAKIETKHDKDFHFVSIFLRNASLHDQNIFNTAISEMLSPIENPRYILIAKTRFKRYNYELSFACPSIIGKKREYVNILAKKLKETTGNFDIVYTHKEDGRNLILKCRKHSYITYNEIAMGKKYKVSHWE